MTSEWKQNSTVQAGGRVEVVVPGLHGGETVEVSVRFTTPGHNGQRPVGLLSGRVRVAKNFDEPLEEFDSYT